jgi:hypothetical protein
MRRMTNLIKSFADATVASMLAHATTGTGLRLTKLWNGSTKTL